jgi:hypothetical protein
LSKLAGGDGHRGSRRIFRLSTSRQFYLTMVYPNATAEVSVNNIDRVWRPRRTRV